MNMKYRVMLAGLAVLGMIGSPEVGAQNVLVTLTITRVNQIDNVDDTRPGEFYASVQMGRRIFPKTGHREDDKDVSPNWSFRRGARMDSPPFPIWIAIWDDDSPESDDHCDVSPVNGKKTLEIRYDPSSGQVSGDITGEEGELIHTGGIGDPDRVEIWFRLTQKAVSPPARGIYPGDLSASCGSCTISRSDGEYERTTSITIACPWIESVEPDETYPEQWISIRGQSFGDFANRIGPCYEGEKKVMLVYWSEEGGGPMPEPIGLRVSNWSDEELFVQIPANISPGRYRLGIFYPLIPGSHLSFGMVSNMVTVRIER